jgi:DNA-binding PadR family transcriptional regulator
MMLDCPKYGYQIKREAGWILGRGEDLHNNLVYPSLRRFLEEGWASKKAIPGERGQTRQQYALTTEGRRYLFERLHEFSESDAASEGAFNLRVGFFAALKAEAREAVLVRRENYLHNRDRKLALLQANMELGKFGGEIVRHMREQIEMEGMWIQRLRRMAKTAKRKRRMHENSDFVAD